MEDQGLRSGKTGQQGWGLLGSQHRKGQKVHKGGTAEVSGGEGNLGCSLESEWRWRVGG